MNKAVKAAGMEDEGVTIHSLRHTYASFAIAQGADAKTLQMQLGHSSPSITLNTYTALCRNDWTTWPTRSEPSASANSCESGMEIPRRLCAFVCRLFRRKISLENLMFPRAPVG